MQKIPKGWIGYPVRVEWVDAATSSRWESGQILLEVMRCTTWGLLRAVTDNEVVIGFTMAETEEWNAQLAIPAGWIHNVKRLEER